ncbi:MAG: hypothetical protein JWL96_1374 [Sphingomonas bacterium]|nr:hypothetical protein [Sphingomonas bacterium]
MEVAPCYFCLPNWAPAFAGVVFLFLFEWISGNQFSMTTG